MTIDSTLRTVAILNLGDTVESNSYIIAASGGATLLLDNYGSDAQLNQTATSHGDTLDGSLSVLLGSNLTTTNASANALTVNSNISATFAGAKIITNAGTGTGAVILGGDLSDGTGRIYVEQNSLTSPLIMSGTNTYTGWTTITGGVLRGVPADSWLSFNSGNDNNLAILEASGTFTRDIGKHQGNVFWNQRGGFAASGGDLTVTLNGGLEISWGDNKIGLNSKTLMLGSRTATNKVTLTNDIALGGNRTLSFFDNPDSTTDESEVAGSISGSGNQLTLKGDTGALLILSVRTATAARRTSTTSAAPAPPFGLPAATAAPAIRTSTPPTSSWARTTAWLPVSCNSTTAMQ